MTFLFLVWSWLDGNQRDPDGDEQRAEPAAPVYVLAHPPFRDAGFQDVTRCRDGNRKADGRDGKQSHEREERHRHDGDAADDPWIANEVTSETGEGGRGEVGDLTVALHPD